MTKLDSTLLLLAYARGYFPMPHPESGDIVWLSPDPRAVIPLSGFHVSRSLAKRLRKGEFRVTMNQAFAEVMEKCGARKETWITDEFKTAYGTLHEMGFAHSIEVWNLATGNLAGGLYGVALQGAFFAESMFYLETDASKVALHALVERMKSAGYTLLEVQFLTPHLKSLGAIEVTASEYTRWLENALVVTPALGLEDAVSAGP